MDWGLYLGCYRAHQRGAEALREEYKDYLEANADYSADLAAMIADFVDYGKTKQGFERLTAKTRVSSGQVKELASLAHWTPILVVAEVPLLGQLDHHTPGRSFRRLPAAVDD
jgi:hypothetical protein